VNRYLVAWGPALAGALVLFGLSELRSVPAALEPLTRIPSLLIHVMIYTAFGLTLAWARVRTGEGGLDPERAGRVRTHAPFLGLGIVYGALDEWHQSFVPGRTPSVLDWLADVTGVIIGYGMGLLLLGWVGSSSGTAGTAGETGPGPVSTARGPNPRDARNGSEGNP
jgi:VanZ family protein